MWAQQEAMVACTQLGFLGGWTIDVKTPASTFASQCVSDFDCSWPERNLQNCLGSKVVTDCTNSSLPAGVHCYSSFSVHLMGGAAPNAGRVEVQYDDTWASVCYELHSTSGQWSFDNALVVCRELGFPGTMFAGQGGMGQGNRKASLYDYKCRYAYPSLRECLPRPPIILPSQYQGPSCGPGSSGLGNEAVTVCSVPGYIGCFKTKSNTKETSHELYLDNQSMTVRKCRNHCRGLGLQLACLYDGNMCLCRETVADYVNFRDENCNFECTGQELETCGSSNAISVYNGKYK
ncbi:lysyl oxidase homolog 2-like [Amphiura filiformis]|uniref:lysyl oxidase homolog 2-like n=1 Tax=Amphiura filiformis TaxID=82378 RepID=UPI003B21E9C9